MTTKTTTTKAQPSDSGAGCSFTGRRSCRGCRYSYDPALYDGGCTLNGEGEKVYLTRAEQRADDAPKDKGVLFCPYREKVKRCSKCEYRIYAADAKTAARNRQCIYAIEFWVKKEAGVYSATGRPKAGKKETRKPAYRGVNRLADL